MIKQLTIFSGTSGNLSRLMTGSLVFLLWVQAIHAQEEPPRPIAIYTAQNLSFGAFFQGVSGGTVTVDYDGVRTVTGDIIPASLGYSFYPLIVDVDAEPGVLITILNGPDATLTGSNGGTLTVHLESANTGSPFINTVSPPSRLQVRIGATLTVGNPAANPAGSYSGSVYVTFIQE